MSGITANPSNSGASGLKLWQIIAGVATFLVVGGSALTIRHFLTNPDPVNVQSPEPLRTVSALGRLEPWGEVIQLAATSPGARIAQLLVQEGDRVRAGQVIAVLDSRERLQAALEQNRRKVYIAQTKLAQVKSGAKVGEINAQKAEIARSQAQFTEDVRGKRAAVARLEAQTKTAQTEFNRYEKLYGSGAVSASQRDSKRLEFDSARQQLSEAKAARDQAVATLSAQVNEAQSTLDRIAEVRPVDVAAAQAEVDSAVAAVQQAQADLNLAMIRAPRTGQVIKVHTWPGEVVSNEGIVDIGQTDRMMAVAEVYDSDVGKIRAGLLATVRASSINETLHGTVVGMGYKVQRQNVINTDPTANIDARIVEVRIQLDPASSRKVAQLTNLQVDVSILLEQKGNS